MKYRVKFRCYWYNTGCGDNHYYNNFEDFDTLDEAKKFADRVNEQFKMCKSYESNKIIYSEFKSWQDSFEMVEVENGFIDGTAELYKYYPEREEKI